MNTICNQCHGAGCEYCNYEGERTTDFEKENIEQREVMLWKAFGNFCKAINKDQNEIAINQTA